jgi:hypothetical protein
MAFIAEKLEKPVVERLDLTRHYITFDCDFACYMVLNPSRADLLEGSDVVQIPIGSWQVDAWRLLVKEDYPNHAGFSAVFVYDETMIDDIIRHRPSVRYSDVDIAHAVSGLRGQPVNVTQFTCSKPMPVQLAAADGSGIKEMTVTTAEGAALQVINPKERPLEAKVLSLPYVQHLVYPAWNVFMLREWMEKVPAFAQLRGDAYWIDLCRCSVTFSFTHHEFGASNFRICPSGVAYFASPSHRIPPLWLYWFWVRFDGDGRFNSFGFNGDWCHYPFKSDYRLEAFYCEVTKDELECVWGTVQ